MLDTDREIIFSLENEPGRSYQIAKEFGEKGVNIESIVIIPINASYGLVRLMVNDVKLAIGVLAKLHIPNVDFNRQPVVIDLINVPGSLARLLEPLKDAKINIEFMYKLGDSNLPGWSRLLLGFNGNKSRAFELLKGLGIDTVKIVCPEMIEPEPETEAGLGI